MISNFPAIYEDEIIYSVLSRYALTTGNENNLDTVEELFGKRYVKIGIEFTCLLNNLVQNIDYYKYTAKYLIMNHSAFPYYAPFLSENSKIQLFEQMIYGDASSIYSRVGLHGTGIGRKNCLYYCPECVSSDIKIYDEAYFHRIHQMQGVVVCPKHGCLLCEYDGFKLKEGIRTKFTVLDEKKINHHVKYENDSALYAKLRELAVSIEYLINNDLTAFNSSILQVIYRKIIMEKGYANNKGNEIAYVRLIRDFINYYPPELFEKLGVHLNIEGHRNWFARLYRKPFYVIHPLKHLLMIHFLMENAEKFFKHYQAENGGFETDLSQTSENLFSNERDAINEVSATTEMHEINKYDLVRYKLTYEEDNNRGYSSKVNKTNVVTQPKKNDFNNKASQVTSIKGRKVDICKIDWRERDKDVLKQVKKIQKQLLRVEPPIRISKNLISKYVLPKNILIKKSLEQMPRTSKYIKNVCETIEDIYLRKINYWSGRIYKEKGWITRSDYDKRISLRYTPNIKLIDEIIAEKIDYYNNL
jgi:hypothetical protein